MRVTKGQVLCAAGASVACIVLILALHSLAPSHTRPTESREPTLSTSRTIRRDPATIAYLVDAVAQAESGIKKAAVQFIVKSHFDRQSSIDLRQSYSKTHYSWVTDGLYTRFESAELAGPPRQSYYVWDGHTGRTLYMLARPDGTLDRQGIEISDDAKSLNDSFLFYELSTIRLFGRWLSEAIHERGLSAVHKGATWEVSLECRFPGNSRGLEILTIRQDRGYRPSAWRQLSEQGNVLMSMNVLEWRKVGSKVWMPTVVKWRHASGRIGVTNCSLVSGAFGETVHRPNPLIPDDGITPIYDRRNNRLVRRAKEHFVPLTSARLEATVQELHHLLDKPPPSTTYSILHDNGARGQHDLCGLESIWVVAQLNGRPVTWSDLKHRHPGTNGKHSMAELESIAVELGLPIRGMQVGLAALDAVPVPFILFLDQSSHFCAVVRVDQNRVVIYDPPARVMQLPRKELRRIWGSGYVLCNITN